MKPKAASGRFCAAVFLIVVFVALQGASCEIVKPSAKAVTDVPSAGKFPHALFGRLLDKAVADGLVDYAAVSVDEALLEEYLAEIARVSPDSHPHLFPTEPDRLAYWINAHNACALRGVLRFNRPASLKEIAHKFDSETTYVVGGRNLSLNAMTLIAYRRFTDARVHFALVKARRGGPPLQKEPWEAADLDARLEARVEIGGLPGFLLKRGTAPPRLHEREVNARVREAPVRDQGHGVEREISPPDHVRRLRVELVRDFLEAGGPVESQDAAQRAGVVRVDPVGEPVGLGREKVGVRVRRDARDLGEVLLEERLVDRYRRIVHEAVRHRFIEKAAEEGVREFPGRRDVGDGLGRRLYDFARRALKRAEDHDQENGGAKTPGRGFWLHGAFSR